MDDRHHRGRRARSPRRCTTRSTRPRVTSPPANRAELAWALADIYEYRVDMSRDLQPNDVFRVLVERRRGPQGAVRLGAILAATFTVGGSELQAVRHQRSDARIGYFDQEGKSMRAAFLRAPLEFRRISSVFGMRRHPDPRHLAAARGTDYAASQGTPVRSVGDGVVIFAGRKGGYGNVIEVRHPNGFVTRYGHLRGFAQGDSARRARRHRSDDRIRRHDRARHGAASPLRGPRRWRAAQPRVALAMKGGEPLPASERDTFARDARRVHRARSSATPALRPPRSPPVATRAPPDRFPRSRR